MHMGHATDSYVKVCVQNKFLGLFSKRKLILCESLLEKKPGI